MSSNAPDHDRLRSLMMAALDGEIDADGRRELDAALAIDPALVEEWRRLQEVTRVTRDCTLREPPDEVWQEFPKGVYNRLERGLGWVLASAGAVVLIVWGLYRALADLFARPDLPTLVKAAVVAVIAGVAILLVSAIRERLLAYRHEPYREVER